jgi:hypothetical protein
MDIVTNSQLHTIHMKPVMTSVFIFRFSDVISIIADHPKKELGLNGKKFVKNCVNCRMPTQLFVN